MTAFYFLCASFFFSFQNSYGLEVILQLFSKKKKRKRLYLSWEWASFLTGARHLRHSNLAEIARFGADLPPRQWILQLRTKGCLYSDLRTHTYSDLPVYLSRYYRAHCALQGCELFYKAQDVIFLHSGDDMIILT